MLTEETPSLHSAIRRHDAAAAEHLKISSVNYRAGRAKSVATVISEAEPHFTHLLLLAGK